MKADLSRTTFNRLKHFSRVVAQQGRVQVDADWNEQSSIMLYQLRRLAADIIGRSGGPAGNLGFGLSPLDPNVASNAMDFVIGAGHYYVDGILCEVDATWLPVAFPDAKSATKVQIPTVTVDGLAFRPGQYVGLLDAEPGSKVVPVPSARITDVDYANRILTLTDIAKFISAGPKQARLQRLTTFLTQPEATVENLDGDLLQIYLDVWERLVTYVEDDAIREVALNGPDTAARTKVVWQVKALPTKADACLSPAELGDLLQPANRGRLKARVRPGPTDTDPCTIDPDASYRGHENQLYRVEIHTGNTGEKSPGSTFKWSRENGAVVFPIVSGGGTSTLVLESLGRDDRFGLAEGDWVAIEDDDSVFRNRAAPLLRVQSIRRGSRSVVLAGDVPGDVGKDPAKHPLIRRWDHRQGDPAEGGLTLGTDNAALIPDAAAGQEGWLELEDGVEVQFVDPENAVYRTGDYWLIPARVATGDVEWPAETVPGDPEKRPLAMLPDGVIHHYASLGLVAWDGKAASLGRECRLQIPGAVLVPAAKRVKVTPGK